MILFKQWQTYAENIMSVYQNNNSDNLWAMKLRKYL